MLEEKEILRKKRNLINLSRSFTPPPVSSLAEGSAWLQKCVDSVKCLNPTNQRAFRKKVLGLSICSTDKVSAATSLSTRFPSAINLFQLRTEEPKIYNVEQEKTQEQCYTQKFRIKEAPFVMKPQRQPDSTKKHERHSLDWLSITQEGIDKDMNHLWGWLVSMYRSVCPGTNTGHGDLDRQE